MKPRRRYRVQVERDGRWWLVTVLDLPRARTQARRLDRVESTARDLISLLLQVPSDSFDLETDVRLPPRVAQALTNHRESRREFESAQTRVGSATAEAAHRLVHDAKLTYREAATLLDLSFQRVHKLVSSR